MILIQDQKGTKAFYCRNVNLTKKMTIYHGSKDSQQMFYFFLYIHDFLSNVLNTLMRQHCATDVAHQLLK